MWVEIFRWICFLCVLEKEFVFWEKNFNKNSKDQKLLLPWHLWQRQLFFEIRNPSGSVLASKSPGKPIRWRNADAYCVVNILWTETRNTSQSCKCFTNSYLKVHYNIFMGETYGFCSRQAVRLVTSNIYAPLELLYSFEIFTPLPMADIKIVKYYCP